MTRPLTFSVEVLILILLEVTQIEVPAPHKVSIFVLILILLEVTQIYRDNFGQFTNERLNPYSTGSNSNTLKCSV